jgi:DnaJ-class molecular chaperone
MSRKTTKPCPNCEGTGKVVDAFGQEHICPVCFGWGIVNDEGISDEQRR